MPKEKFYPSEPDMDVESSFEVSWHNENPGVYIHLKIEGEHAASSCVPMDRSGVNRLIRVLRKARNQSFGVDE